MQRVKVGTRGSLLALRQTAIVIAALQERFPWIDFSVEIVRTEGDRVSNRPISQFSDKGAFVRALEHALQERIVDLAVHSLKDVPGEVESDLELAAFLPREDARDALVTASGCGLAELPAAAVIGTSSLRRTVELHAARPDLRVRDIRGNVDTRLQKVRNGQYDGAILAVAGLRRLNREDSIAEYLETDQFVPDAGQGIIAIQARKSDPVGALTQAVDDGVARAVATVERSAVRAMRADCRSPVGIYATIDETELVLVGMAATESGDRVVRDRERTQLVDAETQGSAFGLRLLKQLTEGG